MSLKDDIVQSRFESAHHKAFVNILYTHSYLINQLNDFFKSHKITRQQFNVLRILRGQYPNPVTINLIKERMLDKMSDASRIVERLRVKKLVTRRICLEDRRTADVTISEKGLALLNETDVYAHKFKDLLGNLSEDEAEALSQLLDKIRER